MHVSATQRDVARFTVSTNGGVIKKSNENQVWKQLDASRTILGCERGKVTLQFFCGRKWPSGLYDTSPQISV